MICSGLPKPRSRSTNPGQSAHARRSNVIPPSDASCAGGRCNSARNSAGSG
jgi:hypothetical protein